MWRSCCGAPWTVSGFPMPSRDRQPRGPTLAPSAAGTVPCLCLCAQPGGRRPWGGSRPTDLLCAVPKCRVVSSSLMFMPLYKRQRICRMVFPVCSFYKAQLRLSASARSGAAPLPAASGRAGESRPRVRFLQPSLRTYLCASVFYRGDPVPRAGGGSLRCQSPLRDSISSSAPDGCGALPAPGASPLSLFETLPFSHWKVFSFLTFSELFFPPLQLICFMSRGLFVFPGLLVVYLDLTALINQLLQRLRSQHANEDGFSANLN